MNQDYILQAIRTAAILTNSYVAGTVLSYANVNPALRNQLNILIDFTIGSLTSSSIKVEYSHDGSAYFQETFLSISGGTATGSLGVYTFTGTGKFLISVPIKANYIKISAIGTGTVTSSTMTVSAVVGTA